MEHVLSNENAFRSTLAQLLDLPIAGDLRGEGFFYALELVKDKETRETFTDEELAGWMKSQPEGFWWFESGELEDDRLREDLQERVPKKYGERGYVDFQVLDDTVIVHETTGKAELRVRVSEGDVYRVGTFEIVGNRRFTTGELEALYPFRSGGLTGFLGLGSGSMVSGATFDQEEWEKATQEVRTRYYNNGYIYAQVRGDVMRRAGADVGDALDAALASAGPPVLIAGGVLALGFSVLLFSEWGGLVGFGLLASVGIGLLAAGDLLLLPAALLATARARTPS